MLGIFGVQHKVSRTVTIASWEDVTSAVQLSIWLHPYILSGHVQGVHRELTDFKKDSCDQQVRQGSPNNIKVNTQQQIIRLLVANQTFAKCLVQVLQIQSMGTSKSLLGGDLSEKVLKVLVLSH